MLNGTVPTDDRWLLALLCVVVGIYLSPSAQHEPTKVHGFAVHSPPSPMRIDILTTRLRKLKLKRDGGLSVAVDMDMKIHNALPAPFRVRGINMTASFRMLGSEQLYRAGFQAVDSFAAPPLGWSHASATYVLDDLRFGMLIALFYDIIAHNQLVTYSYGNVKLWPAGNLDLSCVLTAPLGSLSLVNTCRAKLI